MSAAWRLFRRWNSMRVGLPCQRRGRTLGRFCRIFSLEWAWAKPEGRGPSLLHRNIKCARL